MGKKSAQPLIQLQTSHLSAKFQQNNKHGIRVIHVEEEFWGFFVFFSLCIEKTHLHLMPDVCDANCFQLLVNKQLITTFIHVRWQPLVAFEVITSAKEEVG